MTIFTNCKMCDRPLNVEGDLLSEDCGGDCWGCIGLIEAQTGDPESLKRVVWECAFNIRPAEEGKLAFPEIFEAEAVCINMDTDIDGLIARSNQRKGQKYNG